MNVTARVTSRAHEVSRTRSILRKVRAATLGLVSVAVSALIFYPVPAAADPPLTVAEARSLVAQLQTDAGAIDQQYSGVKEQIKQGRAQLRLKQADVKLQTDKVARMRLQVGQVALAQFQNRSLDTAAQLIVTPDTDGFLSQISTVQNVSENQNSVLQDYQQAEANLGALEHSAEIDLATLAEKEKQLKSLADASDKKIAEAKKVLAKLSGAQRHQIAAADHRAERARRSCCRNLPKHYHYHYPRQRQRGQGAGICESSARRTVCSQCRRSRLMGLLRPDDESVGLCWRQPPAFGWAAVQPGSVGSQVRSPTR